MSSRLATSLLVGAVVVTVAATVLYIQEPHWPGSDVTIDNGHVVPTSHRIAAIDADGRVEQIDDRTGATAALPFTVSRPADAAPGVALVGNRLSAYVTDGNTIDLVHLDTGEHRKVTDGTNLALSPDGDGLAFVRRRSDGLHLVIENTDTGKENDLGPAAAPALDDVRALAWTADGHQAVVLTGSSTQPLWLVGADAHGFDDARPASASLAPGATIDAIAPFAKGFAVAARRPDGTTDVVQVNGSGAGGSQVLTSIDGHITSLASDRDHSKLLMVVERAGSTALYRWDGRGDPQRLTDGVVAASW